MISTFVTNRYGFKQSASEHTVAENTSSCGNFDIYRHYKVMIPTFVTNRYDFNQSASEHTVTENSSSCGNFSIGTTR